MSDVTIEMSFAEALTVVGALHDYASIRRSYGEPEDALLGAAYHSIRDETISAGRLNREAFNRGHAAVMLPTHLNEEVEE